MPATSFLRHPRIMTRAFTVHRLVPYGSFVTRDHEGTWVVHDLATVLSVAGKGLAELEATDFETRLRELEVDSRLELAGVHPGELVRIGRLEFELNAPATGVLAT